MDFNDLNTNFFVTQSSLSQYFQIKKIMEFKNLLLSVHKTNLIYSGDGSGGYRQKPDQSTAHGRGVEACRLAFPVTAPVLVPGRQCQNT